ncbi:unnamed protein product [Peronospora belbahrii]|uniref:Uncharacterized protein n=1 Tax=Peronospora belbahrii TaxID=622444 RepID=A0AAU9L2N8_9STRA|nr:unnamed protein product [Peronospora belbahrii]
MPAMEVAADSAGSRVPMEISGSIREMLGDPMRYNFPLELKLLSALVVLLLFLLFLIMVLWDRYGKEIGELYTSPISTMVKRQNASDVKVHDVADEFSIYQKLPTFFYEYVPRRTTRKTHQDKRRECKI